MQELGLGRRSGIWVLGSLTFGLAEILTAPDPTGAEPVSLLVTALGLYAAVGLVAGCLWHAVRQVASGLFTKLPSPLALGLDDRILALVPAFVLLAPKLRFAFERDPVRTVACLPGALLFLLAMLWLPRRLGTLSLGTLSLGTLSLGTYAVVALGTWTILLRIKGLARMAEEKTSSVALDTTTYTLFAVAALLAAAAMVITEAKGRRALSALAALSLLGISLLRLVQSPAYDLKVEQAAERLGRGTPVILVVLDTTRADHLSLYGYPRPTTPQLEAFAEHAMVFDRATSTSSWTLPAHASLFTGLLPLAHGAMRLPGLDEDAEDLSKQDIHRPAYPLAEEFQTLAEWFSKAGYSTGAVVANYAYMDPAFNVDQGFDDYFAVRSTPVEPRILKVINRRRPMPGVARHWQVYRNASQINELAVRWLESRDNNRFFLFLNYMEAHLPWGPHQPGLHYDEFAAEPTLPDRPAGSPAPDDAFRRRVDLYDSNIASMDAELGKLFDRLRAMELFDRSLIVITADHGESFGENAFDGHGKSLNEAEIHVPLLIKYPESAHVGRDRRRVQLVDVAPTITDILGQSFAERIDGRAVRPATRENVEPAANGEDGAEGPQPIVLAELYTDPREPAEAFHGYRAAVYGERFKLVVRSDGSTLLFAEQNGLEWPVEKVPDELQTWVATQTAFVLQRREVLEQAAKSRQSELELDPEVAAGLEALGYI